MQAIFHNYDYRCVLKLKFWLALFMHKMFGKNAAKCFSAVNVCHAMHACIYSPAARTKYMEITAVGLGHSLIAFTFWSLIRRGFSEVSNYYIFQMQSAQPVIFWRSWGENCQIIHCTVIINAC